MIGVSAERTDADFHFGEFMSATGQGQRQQATRPGSRITTLVNLPPGPPLPIPPQALLAGVGALEGTPGQPPGGPPVGDSDVAGSQVNALNSLNVPDVILADPATGSDILLFSDQVLSEAELAEALQSITSDANTGFIGAVGGLVGRYKTTPAGSATGSGDSDSFFNIPFQGGAISSGFFRAQPSLFSSFAAPVGTPGTLLLNFANTGTTSPFGPLTGRSFLSPDSDFVYVFAKETDFTDDFTFLFAGSPTPAAAVASAGGALYSLTIDHTLGRNGGIVSPSTIPFIRPSDGGNLRPEDSARATILWDSANRPFFAVNGIISGSGSSQRNALSLIVGNMLNDAANRPHLRGVFGGVARNSATGRVVFMHGDAATQDAGDGSDLFGLAGPHFFALEAAKVDSTDLIIERGVDADILNITQATYFPNVVGQRINAYTPASRTTETLKGFAGGIIETSSASGGSFLGARKFFTQDAASPISNNVSISKNASSNTVNGQIIVRSPISGGVSDLTLLFGNSSADGNSAFIDDRNFAAVSPDGVNGSTNGTANQEGGIGIVAGGNVDFSGAIPVGVSLCACPFATWGFFGADMRASTGQLNQIGLAQYVTGAIAPAPLPSVGTATYTGNVIATVANGSFTGTPAIYTAVGALSLAFDFGISPGVFSITAGSITNLDSGTYSLGGSGVTGTNAFSGTVTGSRPGFAMLHGNHRGAFVGTGTPPAGLIGDIVISDSTTTPTYQLGGIMFGARP
jgi:hypothetical protein